MTPVSRLYLHWQRPWRRGERDGASDPRVRSGAAATPDGGPARVAARRAGACSSTSASTPSPIANGATATKIPAIFAPAKLDARQWARAARRGRLPRADPHRQAPRRLLPLADQRRPTHSVARSPWRGGRRRRRARVRRRLPRRGAAAGLYLSPWDRNDPVYGDSPRYNDFYCDAAHRAADALRHDRRGLVRRRQRRRAERQEAGVRLAARLGPGAAASAGCGDVLRRRTRRALVRQRARRRRRSELVDGRSGRRPRIPARAATGVDRRRCSTAIPNGSVWRPGEADVSIRPGWFYHPAEDERVRSGRRSRRSRTSRSVGRNSKLLLNVPPTRDGLLHDVDVDAACKRFTIAWDQLFATTSPANDDQWRSQRVGVDWRNRARPARADRRRATGRGHHQRPGDRAIRGRRIRRQVRGIRRRTAPQSVTRGSIERRPRSPPGPSLRYG